jgi:hypothetical protein
MVRLIECLPVFRENACRNNCSVALITEFNNTQRTQVETLFGCSDSVRAARLPDAFRVHRDLLTHLTWLSQGSPSPKYAVESGTENRGRRERH